MNRSDRVHEPGPGRPRDRRDARDGGRDDECDDADRRDGLAGLVHQCLLGRVVDVRRRAGGAALRPARGRWSGRSRVRRTRSSAAAAGESLVTRWGRPGRIRIPLSGSSVSSTSPTAMVPRPSNTTSACSAPGWTCQASVAPGIHLHLGHRERHGPEVAGLDEEPAPDAGPIGDAGLRPASHGLVVLVPAAEHLAEVPRRAVERHRREQRERVGRALVAHPVELRRRLVQHVARAHGRAAGACPRRARTRARRPRGRRSSRRRGGAARSRPRGRCG